MGEYMRLIALQKINNYNHRTIEEGEEFDAVSDEDARILILIAKAKEKEQVEQKRTYKRRDMVAEQ